MSAVTPAPEDGSKPARVRTTFGVSDIVRNVLQTAPSSRLWMSFTHDFFRAIALELARKQLIRKYLPPKSCLPYGKYISLLFTRLSELLLSFYNRLRVI